MNSQGAWVAICLLVTLTATASTNGLSDAEIEGRALVGEILNSKPSDSSTNFGILHIRDSSSRRYTRPIRCDVVVSETNWFNVYEMLGTNLGPSKLVIFHDIPGSNRYELTLKKPGNPLQFWTKTKSDAVVRLGFAGDFAVADLGLEFFNWPSQKVLKHKMKRGQACKVLESRNPSTNGYSRVVSWIDNDTLGIVQAEAFDMKGKLLKSFEPKKVEKVDGQWQLQEIEIRNVQTGSRTRLEIHFDKK